MNRYQSKKARHIPTFAWRITCRSGTLAYGHQADFLLAMVFARHEKTQLSVALPTSILRVQLLYPNGERVSKQDIRAALNALANPRIAAVVSARLVASADVPPAAQARTERTADATHDSAVSPQMVFCQAGVVAPPDGLTGETSIVREFVELDA